MTSWLAAAVLLQAPPMAPSMAPGFSPVGTPPRTVGIVRLAKSPLLDGRMDPEEWEAFSMDGPQDNSFQWEPDLLHWACVAPAGMDVVLSLDQNADGWLVGKDNLEVRVILGQGAPTVRARILDATTPGQPQWREEAVPGDQIRIAASPSPSGGFVVESTFVPLLGRGPSAGKRVALRMDTVAPGAELTEVYAPRALASVFLQYDSSRDLPAGVSWRPSVTNRSTAYLDRLKLAFGLRREEGSASFTRVEARGEGSARASLAEYTQPVSSFDSRGRLDLSYESVIAPGAPIGWRVVRAGLRGPDGSEVLLRTSVRIADLLDIELGFPSEARSSADAQIIRGHVTLRSQFTGRLQGIFSMTAPAEWSVTKGKEQDFLIYHTRGTARIPVEFVIPRGQSGSFPLTFKAQIGDRAVERRVFFAVD